MHIHTFLRHSISMHCNFVTMDCISGDIIISDGVTFTVDTDDGASPQFTLTCISTGGPATNVTWTRDSDTVTEGTETVLDNRTTAEYTHTLTSIHNTSIAQRAYHVRRLYLAHILYLYTCILCLPGKQEVVGSSPIGGAEFL